MHLEEDPDLTDFVETAAKELGVPGAAVGVLLSDRALTATVGVTSTADPLPVDADTLFMIGSTTKTMTATALMALADRERVRLHDRVIEHLPDLRLPDPQAQATVSVLQLLNHTSGWRGDLPAHPGWGEDALRQAVVALQDAPQDAAPGRTVSYSNSAFMLAGHLLAHLHGTSYEDAIRDLVLSPLGMTNTWFQPWDIAHRRHAVGHLLRDGEARAIEAYPVARSSAPGGGAWSSLRDQLTYARFHLDGTSQGTAPLLDDTRLRMQEPTVKARAGIDGVGLSWLLTNHGVARLVTHGGNISNLQTSSFAIAPDHSLAVMSMGNSRYAKTLGDRVQAWALEHYAGVAAPSPLATRPFDADDYVGEFDLGMWSWSLRSDGGKLNLHMALPTQSGDDLQALFAGPPIELVSVGPDLFAPAGNPTHPTVEVRRDHQGEISSIVHGMRLVHRTRATA